MSFVIFSGFLIGLVFGFVLQRGYFCHLSGFVDLVIFKNKRVLLATLWAILISLIGFHLMDAMEIVKLSPKPFWVLANIAGGLIFGAGMFMASACMGGSTFKIGNGYVGYILAAIGMGFGAYATKVGFLKSFSKTLQDYKVITISGKSPTLSSILGVDSWIVVVVLSLLLIWLLYRLREKKEKDNNTNIANKFFIKRWSPAIIGVSIGLIQMIAFYASTKSGKNYPISLTGGYSQITKSIIKWDFSLIDWSYLLVLGIVFGALIASVVAGEFKLKIPNFKQAAFMLIGGVLLGIGAGIADGCNIGHTLSGIPLLSIGSIVTSISIFIGLYLIVYFRLVRNKEKDYGIKVS